MATRIVTSDATPNAMAMSALFYGYAGNSANTPYTPPITTWWDDKRIKSTVTRDFVGSKLPTQRRSRLDREVGFGSDLTDETYSGWILGKAKRLVLILVDIGIPEEIFKLIDQSLDDEDLPIPLPSLEQLSLIGEKDGVLARKFHRRQYTYMLRGPSEGDHIIYAADELVPIEPVDKKPSFGDYRIVEKVTLSDRTDKVFHRRRIQTGDAPGKMTRAEFMQETDAMKQLVHQHIVSIYATYSYQDSSYVLLSPASELTLRNFLTIPPPQFRVLAKQERRRTVLTWLHCMSDALTFLHDKGVSHGELQPSNVLVDNENHIILGVPEKFRKLRTDKRPSTLESYEYGAPEKWVRSSNTPAAVPLRQKPSSNKGWKLSVQSAPTPVTEYFNFSSGSSSPISTMSWPTRSVTVGRGWRSQAYDSHPADIYSLGCIYLDIITHLLKKKIASFISHRSAKNKKMSRLSGPADASFHGNAVQVEDWISQLRRDSLRRKDEVFDGVPAILIICQAMLDPSPAQRPEAWEIEKRLADILCSMSHMTKLHCRPNGDSEGNWDFCCSGKVREIQPMRSREMSRASDRSRVSDQTSSTKETKPWEYPPLPPAAELGIAY
jgi:serine/threonine protein kinase